MPKQRLNLTRRDVSKSACVPLYLKDDWLVKCTVNKKKNTITLSANKIGVPPLFNEQGGEHYTIKHIYYFYIAVGLCDIKYL